MTDDTTSLEEHIAHHAMALDDISRQMADQWAAIQRIERTLERLSGHVKALGDTDGAPEGNVPPPHY